MNVRPADEMTCRELVRVITEYLEDTLPAPDRARVEDHLASCPWCTNYLEQMREVLRVSGRITEADVSPEAEARLLDVFRDWKRGSR